MIRYLIRQDQTCSDTIKLELKFDCPAVLSRQSSPAVLPSSLARQSCPAVLPGSLARQSCPAVLPGSLARQSCPAVLPGSLGRQSCPAVLPIGLARQSCPAVFSTWSDLFRLVQTCLYLFRICHLDLSGCIQRLRLVVNLKQISCPSTRVKTDLFSLV
jgi:hypothetical protein